MASNSSGSVSEERDTLLQGCAASTAPLWPFYLSDLKRELVHEGAAQNQEIWFLFLGLTREWG